MKSRSTAVRSSPVAGVTWMLGATSAIALVDAIAKLLSARLHGIQVAWGYFAAMLLCLLIALPLGGRSPRRLLRSLRPGLQLARATCLMMSLCCLFVSLRYLPLADATTIGFTAPLFIVALSGPLLGERVTPRRWLAVALGMAGAVIVARPGVGALHWAAAVALIGSLFFALFNILTRKLGNTDATRTTLLYSFGLGTLMLSLAVPVVWVEPGSREWALLLLSGLLGLFAHFAIVRSLSLADASTVAPLNYTRLAWAIGIGMALFGDVPDAMTLLGGGITIASGLYVVFSAAR